jgi:hypothetical protein
MVLQVRRPELVGVAAYLLHERPRRRYRSRELAIALALGTAGVAHCEGQAL